MKLRTCVGAATAMGAVAAVSFGLGALRGAAASSGSSAARGVERSATSTVSINIGKEDSVTSSVVNRRFTATHYYAGGVGAQENFRTLLLEEEFKSDRVIPSEGADAVVKVDAWAGKGASPSEKLWTISAPGDTGQVWGRFYQVTRLGCCGSEGTQTMFNLESGQRVFATTLTANGGLFQVEIPNTSNELKRYVGYLSDVASLRPSEADSIKGFAGYIQWGSESRVLQRVLVKHFGPDAETGSPEIKTLYRQKISSESPLELWGVDKQNKPAAIGAFSLILSYGRGVDIVIPVTGDHLDIARARVPRGFAVEPVD